MDRRTIRVAIVAALCIVALGAAAATLDTARTTGGGMGPGSSGDAGVDEDPGGSIYGNDSGGSANPFPSGGEFGVCIGFLRSAEFLLAAAAVVLGVFAVVSWRRNKTVAGAFVLAWGLPLFVVYLILAACPGDVPRMGGGNASNASLPGGGGMPGAGSGTSPAPPSLLVLALLGLVFLLAVAVVVRTTGDEEVELQRPEDPDEEDDPVEAIGRVAGEAADRIDAEGEVDNEVYRAWREMVGLLAVDNPDATTPGEFADAAVEAGMDRPDVDELTDLFEGVRYGDVDPTADREERAVEALRRIEREYADDGGDGW